MSSLHRRIALGTSGPARLARHVYRGIHGFSLPAPRWFFRPLLAAFVLAREAWTWGLRVFVAEPFFKAYCTSYGKRLHTGKDIHWVMGRGRLDVGDDVLIDGKCGFAFGARHSDEPTLTIGDHTKIGHACRFTVSKRITIGSYCRIAGGTTIIDSSGHPSDPETRKLGHPPTADEVKPVTIGDNVWIGMNALVLPGVTIGEGSIVSAASVVQGDVPPYTVVAGNPARRIATLKAPGSAAATANTAANAAATPAASAPAVAAPASPIVVVPATASVATTHAVQPR
jgi:acetyltransferase-like isoleucine patch superfamily enzyme